MSSTVIVDGADEVFVERSGRGRCKLALGGSLTTLGPRVATENLTLGSLPKTNAMMTEQVSNSDWISDC